MKWALNNKVKEVMVLDGMGIEGSPDSKRTPIILSSDGIEADAANLIHDDNIDVKNKEEKVADNGSSVYPTTAFIGDCLAEFYHPVYQMVFFLYVVTIQPY